ncbi:hypothetical protein ALC53_13859 [Atta colombica]|uniref:Uncharacterized protein n=1 Tax=Atta colombica TaxID=520822 RepID=A0A195AUU4_9HYME|nr:hypothetical protein ALC53_13859 [Atta colombica]
MTREPEEGAENKSIYPVYRHTMHGACWIITWRVCVSCDTTVTRVPVNAVCTHMKEAGLSGQHPGAIHALLRGKGKRKREEKGARH